MKYVFRQLSQIPFKKELLPLILLSILSATIWFGGPLIAIADALPLEQASKRSYVILFLFIAWFFKIYFHDTKPQRSAFLPNSSELEKKIQTLADKFEGFISFLTKTFINKNGAETSLASLPWYLLIGPKNSGKTSLLANANIHFILAKKFNQTTLKSIAPSANCDWWVTREMVLVDVPGTYLTSKTKRPANSTNEISSDAALWNKLTNLIKKFRGKRALNGVMLAISLTDLLRPQESVLQDLKLRINELRAQFGSHLPFYLTITKCDALPGFTEFFSDSGIDELSQAWGTTIPALKGHEKLTDVFSQRFDALIKKLNKQLITRLHQERNAAARAHIKDFPIHLEQLKENIIHLIKMISISEKTFYLQSVFLTSAIQYHVEEQVAHHIQQAALASSQSLAVVHNAIMPSRPYFIRHLLMHGLNNSAGNKQRQTWQHRPVLYGLASMITLSAALLIAKDFKTNLKQTNAIRAGLAQYHAYTTQQVIDMKDALPLLDALENKLQASSHTLFFHSSKTKANAHLAYQQALQTIILSQVKNTFESYLALTANKNPNDIYLALKAYLELGSTEHRQPEFIISTLKKISPALLNDENAEPILHHLQSAFQMGLPVAKLNDEQLSETRKYLASLPPAELGYIILKNTDDNAVEVALPLSKDNSIHIPKMYTAAFFQTVYAKQIETAALEAVQGNWILENSTMLKTGQNYAPVVDQLRSSYISNYANVWENLLANTKLPAPSDLTETDNIISSLISDNSPLLQVIHIIKQNTSLAPITAASTKLAAINSQQDRTLTNIVTTLKLLHADLQKILTSHNIANSAFQTAAERMQETSRQEINDSITQLHKLAETSPEPIKNWLHNIAFQSWHYILQEASAYAESHWQTDVMNAYKNQIENRFPLWTDANQETPMDQFTKFFNPHGTFSEYYQSFIQPFTEAHNRKLEWKKIDNEKIPFTDAALVELAQAQALQSVFFPDDSNLITVKFTLQPFYLEKNTQSAALSINGQTIEHDRSAPSLPETLLWTSTQTIHDAKINVTNRVNKTMSITMNGEWGWFRMVNQATTKILSPHELVLSFDVEGHNAKYYLFTKGSVNPFLSLPQLRLPTQLADAKA